MSRHHKTLAGVLMLVALLGSFVFYRSVKEDTMSEK